MTLPRPDDHEAILELARPDELRAWVLDEARRWHDAPQAFGRLRWRMARARVERCHQVAQSECDEALRAARVGNGARFRRHRAGMRRAEAKAARWSAWLAVVLAALALVGCPDLDIDESAPCGQQANGEAYRCADRHDPPHCEAYVNACMNAALEVFINDVDRIGRKLAEEVYSRHRATCDEGWSVCVEQDRRARAAAADGGPTPDGAR